MNNAEEIRHYWEERNKKRLDRIAMMPPPSYRKAAWEKLQFEKARLESYEGYSVIRSLAKLSHPKLTLNQYQY